MYGYKTMENFANRIARIWSDSFGIEFKEGDSNSGNYYLLNKEELSRHKDALYSSDYDVLKKALKVRYSIRPRVCVFKDDHDKFVLIVTLGKHEFHYKE